MLAAVIFSAGRRHRFSWMIPAGCGFGCFASITLCVLVLRSTRIGEHALIKPPLHLCPIPPSQVGEMYGPYGRIRAIRRGCQQTHKKHMAAGAGLSAIKPVLSLSPSNLSECMFNFSTRPHPHVSTHIHVHTKTGDKRQEPLNKRKSLVLFFL